MNTAIIGAPKFQDQDTAASAVNADALDKIDAWAGPLQKMATKTANYTATYSDRILLVDATSGNVTITLPTPVGHAGKDFVIKRMDATGNTLTLATAAGSFDGSGTVSMNTQHYTRWYVSDGTIWRVIGSGTATP